MTEQENTGPVQTYAFTLSFKVGGVVDSSLGLDETLSKLHAELTEFYGEGAYEVIDFHAATEEEILAYTTFMSQDEDVTIN